MRLFEFDSEDAGYYSPDQDNYNIHQLGDTRRPRVTLRHLNQLKRMRAAKKLENLVRRDILGLMYSTPAPEAGAGGAPAF